MQKSTIEPYVLVCKDINVMNGPFILQVEASFAVRDARLMAEEKAPSHTFNVKTSKLLTETPIRFNGLMLK